MSFRVPRWLRAGAAWGTLWGIGIASHGCVSSGAHQSLAADHRALNERVLTLQAELQTQREHVESLDAALRTSQESLVALLRHGETLVLRLEALEQVAHRLDALADEQADLIEERTQLRNSLKDLQRRFADLSQRKQAAEAKAAEYRDIVDRFETLVRALD